MAKSVSSSSRSSAPARSSSSSSSKSTAPAKKAAPKPAASKSTAPARSNSATKAANTTKTAAPAKSAAAPAPAKDKVNVSAEAKAPASSQPSAAAPLVQGLKDNFSPAAAAAPAASAAPAAATVGDAKSAPAGEAAAAAGAAAAKPAAAVAPAAAASAPAAAAPVGAATTNPAAATGPAPTAAEARRRDEAAQNRAAGVPERLDQHVAGPPAPPSNNKFTKEDFGPDGKLKTGTLHNRIGLGDHEYATRNPLPKGLTKDQANGIVHGFNAPTKDAFNGKPNPLDQTKGVVDGTSVLPKGYGQGSGIWGGDVNLHRGTTPDGRAYAVNSTIENPLITPGSKDKISDGAHPLLGHITRTLEEHEGQYYIKTVGRGENPKLNALEKAIPPLGAAKTALNTSRQVGNALVGPPAFNHLDQAAAQYARDKYGLQ